MKKLWLLLVLLAVLLCGCFAQENTPDINETTTGNTTPVGTLPIETTTEPPTQPDDPHEHVYDQNVVITNATCISPGSWQGMCACGEWQRISLDDTAEHSWGEAVITKDPTCTQAGIESV